MSNARRLVLVAIGAVGVALLVVVAQMRPKRSPGIEAVDSPRAIEAQELEPLALEAEVERDAIAVLTESLEPTAPGKPPSSTRIESDHVTLPAGISHSKKEPPTDGWHVTHYPDGALESEGEFQGGKREGLWRDYSETGVLILEGVYDRGEATGVWRAWHENGRVAAVSNCDRGQFHGTCQFWTPEGQPDAARSGEYVKGKRLD